MLLYPCRVQEEEIVATVRAACSELQALYRFGSTAAGADWPESDVDLALLVPRSIPSDRRLALEQELTALLRREVDLVDLRAAPTVLQMQVVGSGTPLAVLDAPARDRFEDFVFASYARLNEERREILERVHREESVYGR